MIAKTIGKIWNNFLHDTLFRNSIYLMLTTGAMGLFGFVFWTIATHIFTPDQIGLGTTIISSMTMISYISILGFNNTFIRFLPTSQNRNKEINSGITIVITTSIVLGIAYIIMIPHITPNLSMISDSISYSLLFILMIIGASLNSLTDSIFIAYRKTQYSLITNGFIVSIVKIILPIFFVSLGAYGVFVSSGLATFIGLITSILILIYKFDFIPKLYFDLENTKKVFGYSFTSYLGSLFSISPTLILPIIIINNLGSADAGYFYLALMIINLLYAVSGSVSQSLFAEGSYGESALKALLKRSVVILSLILIPGSIILGFLGPYILELFGKSYSAGASNVIIILALSSPAVALFNLGSTLLKIRNQMYSTVFINAVYALIIYFLASYWAHNGLIWVSMAWIIGNLTAGILAFILIYSYRHLPTISVKNHTS